MAISPSPSASILIFGISKRFGMQMYTIAEMVVSTLTLILAVVGYVLLFNNNKHYHYGFETSPIHFILYVSILFGLRTILAFPLYFIGWRKKSKLFCWIWVLLIAINILLHLISFIGYVLEDNTGLVIFAKAYTILHLGVGIWVVWMFAHWVSTVEMYNPPTISPENFPQPEPK